MGPIQFTTYYWRHPGPVWQIPGQLPSFCRQQTSLHRPLAMSTSSWLLVANRLHHWPTIMASLLHTSKVWWDSSHCWLYSTDTTDHAVSRTKTKFRENILCHWTLFLELFPPQVPANDWMYSTSEHRLKCLVLLRLLHRILLPFILPDHPDSL